MTDISLDEVLRHAKSLLSNALNQRGAAMRWPILSTCGLDGAPNSRIVVMRSLHLQEGKQDWNFTFHTDRRSQKVKELTANPNASALFFSPEEMLQIRMQGEVSIETNTPTSDKLWGKLSQQAQKAYNMDQAPGEAIISANAYNLREDISDTSNFSLCTFHIQSFETLQIKEPGHVRARFEKASNWYGKWIAP